MTIEYVSCSTIAELDADARAGTSGSTSAGKSRLLLVEVDGDDLELDRRARAQLDQDVEQRVAVLAARDADHDAVAVLDHREVGDRTPDLPVQPLRELGDLDRELAARGGGVVGAGVDDGMGGGDHGRRAHDSYNVRVHEGLDDSSVSAALARRIGAEIDRAGGWIPFSRFMSLALYAPGLGYYASGRTIVGRMPTVGSDFVTAPELSPLFGRALARQLAQALDETGSDELWEFGAGSGALAAELLGSLGDRVRRYSIVEVSAPLRERQRRRHGRSRRACAGSMRCRIRSTASSSPTRCSTRCRSS